MNRKHVAVVAIFATASSVSFGGKLTKESIRELLTQRQTLIEQNEFEKAGGLYTSNATVKTSFSLSAEFQDEAVAASHFKNLTRSPTGVYQPSAPPDIDVDDDGQFATVMGPVHFNLQPGRGRDRKAVWHGENHLTVTNMSDVPRISSEQVSILRMTQQPDELHKRIMDLIETDQHIDKETAIELLKETGCGYKEGDGTRKKNTVKSGFFSFTAGDEVPALATQIPDIEALELYFGAVITDEGMKYIGRIPTLQRLILMSTEITDQGMAELAACTNLTSAVLLLPDISGEALKHLAVLPRLKSLTISGGPETVEHIALLSESCSLTRLELSSEITDTDLPRMAVLTNLTSLSLTGDAITDAGLPSIRDMKNLKGVTFKKTGVTYTGAKQLKEQRPDLNISPESLVAPCKYFRGRIEYAKYRWAKDNMQPEDAEPTKEELDPLLQRYGGTDAMTCEDGGKISINPIGKGASCTIHGAVEARIPTQPLKSLAQEDYDIDGAKVGRWTMDLSAAEKLAAEKQLPILLNFTGSDWCYWCKLMEKNVFTQAAWQTYAAENIVMVLIDFPRDKAAVPEKYKKRNEKLKNQYEVRGYPTFILLRPDGKAEISRLKAGRDKTAASFIKEIKAKLTEEDIR